MKFMQMLEQLNLWNDNPSIAHTDGTNTVYKMEMGDGTAVFNLVKVFPGVELYVYHFYATYGFQRQESTDLLCLDFNAEGRFENLYTNYDGIVMNPGDFGIFYGDQRKRSRFELPLGYSAGWNLLIDTEKSVEWLKDNYPAVQIDFDGIVRSSLKNRWYSVWKPISSLETELRLLFDQALKADPQWLQLKVLSILSALSTNPYALEKIDYYTSRQTELARNIRGRLLENPASPLDVQQLAAENHISVSQLRKVFRSVYGVPIYQYLKEYRLMRAAKDLQITNRSITEIAQDAGFQNPGSFAAAFRKWFGVSPTKYRDDQGEK